METVLSNVEYLLLLSLYHPQGILVYSTPMIGEAEIQKARETVRERGLVKVLPDDEMQVIPSLEALIVTCALSDVSLVVAHTVIRGGEDTWVFHRREQLVVEDRIFPSGEHCLTRLAPGELAKRVFARLFLTDQPPVIAERCVTSRSVFEAARDAARRSGAQGALQVLQEGGLRAEVASPLAEALAQLVSSSALAAVRRAEPQSGMGFGVLEAVNGLWWLRILGEGQVEIAPCTVVKVRQEVENLVASLSPL